MLLFDAGAGAGNMQRIGPKPYSGLADADPALVSYNRARGLDGAALERALAMTAKTEIRHLKRVSAAGCLMARLNGESGAV
ncbi:MAG: hypothetical protein WB646_19700 [Steroidobacteraceae bacterium]